ncbi:sulfotransferase 1 family member D1-like [Oratosquilla oratoria]|uniref:sulfotransferase 1 family member D1-like n=1 Tax=Oratosquilla oratoria TaxID=337810 RepID=UPI003F761C48
MLKSGHEVVPLEEEEQEEQKTLCLGYTEGMVRLQPGGWFYPTTFVKFADQIYDFKLRPDDVMLMTYPKCGTTWVQEIVWTMKNNSNFDHPMAHTKIHIRSPFLELDMMMGSKNLPTIEDTSPVIQAFRQKHPGKDPKDGIFIHLTDSSPGPRVIKTHLPFSLFSEDLLDTCKVVYVARNPLDVCMSYYHHHRLLLIHDYIGSFDQFVDFFIKGDVMYGPYLLHLKEAWEKKGHKNLHIMFYEDMKEDPCGELKRLDAFLETGLSDETIRKIADYTSFPVMKEREDKLGHSPWMNPEVIKKGGGFFRKGTAGDWKGKLTPEQENKIKSWMETGLDGVDIDFKHKH